MIYEEDFDEMEIQEGERHQVAEVKRSVKHQPSVTFADDHLPDKEETEN